MAQLCARGEPLAVMAMVVAPFLRAMSAGVHQVARAAGVADDDRAVARAEQRGARMT